MLWFVIPKQAPQKHHWWPSAPLSLLLSVPTLHRSGVRGAGGPREDEGENEERREKGGDGEKGLMPFTLQVPGQGMVGKRMTVFSGVPLCAQASLL